MSAAPNYPPPYDGRPYVTDTDELLHEIRDHLIEIRELLRGLVELTAEIRYGAR